MQTPYGIQHHFGCLFDMRYTAGSETWRFIVDIIRAWIIKKHPSIRSRADSYYSGVEWRLPTAPRMSVQTLAAQDNHAKDDSVFWALRYEHADETVPHRQWRTDIGLTSVDNQTYRASIVTTHWIVPGFVGQEPSAPTPSAPRVVAALVGAKNWAAYAGSQLLVDRRIPLKVGEGAAFQERLADPERKCPIILVSCDVRTGRANVNAERLAHLLVGAATVYEIPTPNVDEELEWLLPRAYRCWGGAVRIYQPGLRLTSDSDARRHRYIRAEEIEALSAQEAEDMIVRAIVRRSRPWATDFASSIDDVRQKQRERRLVELRRVNQDTSLAEQLAIQEEFIKAVEEENVALRNQIPELKEQLDRIEAEKGELEDQTATIRYAHDHFKHEYQNALARVRQLEGQVEAVHSIAKLPTTLFEVTERIGALWSDRIAFAPEAMASSRRAKINSVPSEIPVAWRCIWSLATILYDLVFAPQRPAGRLEDEFHRLSGFELTLTEGKQTKRDRKMMALRKIAFNGRDLDITPHCKYGAKEPRCLRVHFAIDNERRMIIVGHCGDHLETFGTHRM